MLFNSLHFLVFFPVVVALYYLISQKHRNMLLLIASYCFYMSWGPEYLLPIVLSTGITYVAGFQMSKLTGKIKRRKYVLLSLLGNLGLLFVFKYYNFFSDTIKTLFSSFMLPLDMPYLDLLIPVGISFYTFRVLSYTIDVYQGKIMAEKDPVIFPLYVSFFPLLIAGPIERPGRLLPQFYEKHIFDFDRVIDGLKLILWGFFLKVVVADRLGIAVNHVYSSVTEYTGVQLILATYFFGFQIYCDFAGYSIIAIGIAKVLGFDLMDNFERPYFSKSISEFWRKWHISLYDWFREYVYIPLGGSRVKKSRWAFNVFTVFLISGLWHGAGWTFIIWGGLHGFYLVLSSLTINVRQNVAACIGLSRIPKVYDIIRIFITFNLVSFGWIFFRSNSLMDAVYVITHLFSGILFNLDELILGLSGKIELIVALGSIIFMLFVELLQGDRSMKYFLDRRNILIRWIVYYTLIFSILLFGVFQEQPFIYFQF